MKGKKYATCTIKDRRFTWFFPLDDHPNWSGGYASRMICDGCIDDVNLENPGIAFVLHDEYKKKSNEIWSPGWDQREPGAEMTVYQYSLIEQKAKLFEEHGIPFPEPPEESIQVFLYELKRRRCDFKRGVYDCPVMLEIAVRIVKLDAAIRDHRDDVEKRDYSKVCPFIWKECGMRDDGEDQVSKLEYMLKHEGKMP
jgi:hypothetical protein